APAPDRLWVVADEHCAYGILSGRCFLMELIPNPVRVYDDRDLDLYGAALLTIQCVARWADHYRVWPVGYPPGSRDVEFEGPLPADPKACDALLASAFSQVRDWWLSQPEWRGY